MTSNGPFHVSARWRALGFMLPLLAACASRPTIPNPSTLKTPTKDIVITERHLDVPHEVLGPVEATLGGLRESDLPRSGDAAKQHLRNTAYTKYGERLDAVMDVKTSPVAGGWFGANRGLRAAGIAIALPPADSPDDRTLPEAVETATAALLGQLKRLPSVLGSGATPSIVIDSMLEAPSGQQTAATRLLEQRVADRLRAQPSVQLLPFQLHRLREAQYLLTGTMRRLAAGPAGARDVFQINLALTDMKTGTVIARASARARDDSIDTNPTPYYRDSPVVVRDAIIEGYIGTSETPPGQSADKTYFERVAAATLISEALLAYNEERYQEALALYRNAATTTAGDQLRVVNGIYLATWKLGQAKEAESAFGNVVAYGLRSNDLGVKFLFKPGTTEFWADPQVSGPYEIWLRQIARQAAAAKVCLNVVGHASRTGSEQFNDRLSQQRATYIKKRLEDEAPELASRMGAVGMGFHENIVGTGTDDARDALDRRVEFKITGC